MDEFSDSDGAEGRRAPKDGPEDGGRSAAAESRSIPMRPGPAGRRRSRGRRRNRRSPEADAPQERDPDEPRPLPSLPGDPLILPRTEHTVSRKMIDEDALKVMRRLIRHGYMAYLVGGGVRDLLLNKVPKDFDVGTDASPEEIRTLFRNSRIIGRRFRLNHVYFQGNKIIEVSTFRRSSADDEEPTAEMLLNDNTYGDPETDAVRRDLTINGLFYDLASFSVIDYVGGIQDLRDGVIRIIGDAEQRVKEDPVRMIRAIRHAARANFIIEPKTFDTICAQRSLIRLAAKPRVYEEFLREFRGGESFASIRLLHETGLLPYLLPALSAALKESPEEVWGRLERVLKMFDRLSRSQAGELQASLILAALLIGNLPRSLVEDMEADPKWRPYLEYWQVRPQRLEAGEEEEAERAALPLRLKAGEAASSRRRAMRGRVSRLAKTISRLFEEVGVSRKDRERIEQLLMARYAMLVSDDEGMRKSLVQKPYFNDVLLLLRCTAHTPELEEAAERWEAIAQGERTQREGNRKRSKRRRGRRRQKQ